ncbi:MAG: right-handed parallel beta-helix repeat-containing protein [Pirellulales bacterium]
MRSMIAALRWPRTSKFNYCAFDWLLAMVTTGVTAFFVASPMAFAQSLRHLANREELAKALRELQPSTTLVLANGEYGSDWYITNVDRLTIRAADQARPPSFTGGKVAFHFSKCSHLHLDGLKITGQSQNGLNLDDGGPSSTPPHSIILEHLTIENIGPKGNCDGIKASGIEQLKIQHCSLSGWAGQGIDLVGCHHVLIEQCQLQGKEGYSPPAGIQAKGGSSDIKMQDCQLHDAGERLINIGGSTGLPFFRPQGIHYEAKDVLVRNCQLQGGLCAVAFVGVDGAVVEDNTIHYPQKWIVRILQETNSSPFVPSRNGVFKNNKVLFRREQVSLDCNVGAGTAPETFRFEGNQWYAVDQPQRSKPKLPVEEINGRYGVDFR